MILPTLRAVLASSAIALLSLSAAGQEIGQLQSYGSKGKLYYAFRNDDTTVERYLLSRQSFATEDGSGYQGDINVVYTYYDGAFEMRLISYLVHCFATDPSGIDARTYQGDALNPINSRSVVISKTTRMPSEAEKDEYNLYWAVCSGVFMKFG